MNSTFLQKLIERQDLSIRQAASLMEEMLSGNLSYEQIASVLTALRMKGETGDEIAGFIASMRKYKIPVTTRGVVIDTCGTGGDGKGTFNISTASSFVIAATGVQVAKHGNRASSSQCGSADVLEALGVNIQLSPEKALNMLEKTNFTFLFAPLYHPSMRHVAPVRKELGFRTVFNMLGPFVNPAGVKRQLIGVPNKQIAKRLADVALKLDYEHLLIITSDDGLDEISPILPTQAYEVRRNTQTQFVIDPKNLGITGGRRDEIAGGDAKTNASIIRDVITGKRKGAARGAVIVNAGAGLYVSGVVKNVKEGVKRASDVIDSHGAQSVLERVVVYE